jgi:hypothetical protein
VAYRDQPFNVRIGGYARQAFSALHIDSQQIGVASLPLGAGQVKDGIHPLQRGPDGPLIGKAGNRYVDGSALWEPR